VRRSRLARRRVNALLVEAWAPIHRHLLREDTDLAFVAIDDDEIVGFTAALARGDAWYLSALFVLPAYQGRGVGSELLDRAWAGSFACRITITDSFQPLSNGLYAKRGLITTAITQPQLAPTPRRPRSSSPSDHHAGSPPRIRREQETFRWLARGSPVKPSHFPQDATPL